MDDVGIAGRCRVRWNARDRLSFPRPPPPPRTQESAADVMTGPLAEINVKIIVVAISDGAFLSQWWRARRCRGLHGREDRDVHHPVMPPATGKKRSAG